MEPTEKKKDDSYFWNQVYTLDKNPVWSRPGKDQKTRQIVLENFGNFQGTDFFVLDLGCGNGRNSVIFEEITNTNICYTGLDFSEAAIDYCKKSFSGKNFICFDITSDMSDFPDLSKTHFDLIIDYGCFHCLQPEQRQNYVTNISRLSKKGTTVILGSWYNPENIHKLETNPKPDFKPYGILNEWYVSISDIRSLFSRQFELEKFFIDHSAPHDINNGMLYCVLKKI